MTTFTKRGEFAQGIKDTVPLIIGAIPFGIIFGALGVTGGLSPLATFAMSVFVFAGSSQFVAAGLVAGGVGLGFIILTTLVLNLRHMLYAASLSPYVQGLAQRWLLPLGFWLTDETFAVVVRRYPIEDGSPYKHWYHLGSSIAMYTNWQLCTVIGIIAGTQLKEIAEWGLDFAMVVTFTGITVPLIVNRPFLLCAVVAGVTALLTADMPNKLGLIVAAVAGIVAGVSAEVLLPKPTAMKQEVLA